jgi:hypothetical protein
MALHVLDQADFGGQTLGRADFGGQTLGRADFVGQTLGRADFVGQKLWVHERKPNKDPWHKHILPRTGYSDQAGTGYSDQAGTGYSDQAGTGYSDQAGTGYSDQAGTYFADRNAIVGIRVWYPQMGFVADSLFWGCSGFAECHACCYHKN